MNEIRTKADLVKALDEIIKKFNGGKEFEDKLNDEYIKEHGVDIEDMDAFKFGYLLGTVEQLKINVDHFMKDGESELRSIKSLCKCLVEVENIPDYVELGDTIVVRISNGEFWFYGKYDNDIRAYEVAEEIGGYVMTTAARG